MEENNLLNPRPVSVASDFISQVDIIVPFHGQYQKVTTLIESIFRLTRSNYYTLCLVDDASPNSEFIRTIKINSEKVSKVRGTANVIKAIRSPEQLGFGGACKMGYEMTNSPYVCFINSDCKIEDSGWLRAMGETLLEYKKDGVRMVSPMTNNPVGGFEGQKGDRFERDSKPIILSDDDYLSLYCFLCHRELFSRCGGFIKGYPYGGYEDQEFAARMRANGYKQAVCRKSWVRHEGSLTIKELCKKDPKISKVIEENRKRCIEDMKSLR